MGQGYCVDWIAQRLIQLAARRAPADLSDRLEEEWLADSAALRASIPRLRFACGCCWAAIVIAHEHVVPALHATGPRTEPGHFIRFPRDEYPFFSSGAITFVLVASLQAAVLCGLALGAARWQ